MLGLGTRLCENIKKTHFKIFDCFGGSLIEYFAEVSNFKIEPLRQQSVSVKQVMENIVQNRDRDSALKSFTKRLHRIHRVMSEEARQQFANYIPNNAESSFSPLRSLLSFCSCLGK